MKLKTFFIAVFTFCLLFSASTYSGTDKEILKSPYAFLPEAGYEFSPVLEGALIEHDFIIQNKGAALLNIVKVSPG